MNRLDTCTLCGDEAEGGICSSCLAVEAGWVDEEVPAAPPSSALGDLMIAMARLQAEMIRARGSSSHKEAPHERT